MYVVNMCDTFKYKVVQIAGLHFGNVVDGRSWTK